MEMYKNILCAVDLEQGGKSVCQRAVELVRHYDAKLTLLHVVEHFPEDRSNTVVPPENKDPAEYHENFARNALSDMVNRLDYADATYEVLFTTRSAWHEIVRYAEESGTELIVVGSHGTHGIAALFGSTANSIVKHAPCDVLAVRTPV
jgi:universal stress protein A